MASLASRRLAQTGVAAILGGARRTAMVSPCASPSLSEPSPFVQSPFRPPSHTMTRIPLPCDPRPSSPHVQRAVGASVRFQSTKKEGDSALSNAGEPAWCGKTGRLDSRSSSSSIPVISHSAGRAPSDSPPPFSPLSRADITKYFLDLDASAPKEEVSTLPVRLTGRTGELVAELYSQGLKGKNFDKLVKEVESFVQAVEQAGLVVDRFFSTSNYSPEECGKVVSLLMTSSEPLSSFASIKDADTKEILVDNEANIPVWLNARKAVAALGLSEPVKALINTAAKDGNLSRVKRVAVQAAEVRVATSKTLDAVVTSAVPLSKAQQEAVAKALPQYVNGAAVTPSFVVDPAVLGGLLVSLRNQAIDLTATTRLVEVASANTQLA
jgi:hypothetical protein